jgi:arginine decarboxylase
MTKLMIQTPLPTPAAMGMVHPAARTFLMPSRYALVSGAGDGPSALTAFDRALFAAGAGNFNLVKVTSILPPHAVPGSILELHSGEVVHAAMSNISSSKKDELISAAVAVGVPADPEVVGVLMEGSFRKTASDAEEQVREMARQALIDRGYDIARIESCAVEWRVQQIGSVVAAVLLW